MATHYHSTRSNTRSVSSKEAILTGIAPDGGLFVTDELNASTLDVATICANDYHSNARLVLGALLGDYSADEITRCVAAAYGPKFDTVAVTPTTRIAGDWLLELFHGPTSAFKDVALQMLPQLMSVARETCGTGERIMIVTATSGDTGKAALDGFANVQGTGVTVFYPAGKVSDIQRLQMVTQEGNNVAVCGIRGNFDDAQTEVKRIFADTELRERLAGKGIVLSSANSINVGRLVPQVTYYVDAYAELVRQGAIACGGEVDFCVPTGNFGDVLAGYLAKCMGLPVGKLIVASNANNVLTGFITTGTYDRERPFIKTISPSMDILVSSNLERLLYYLADGDCEYVASLMESLATTGAYTVTDELLGRLQETFACGFATDDETRETIRYTFDATGVLLDPHTAVAKHVLDDINPEGRPRVCLATASPYKFSADVLAALGVNTEGLDGFACMERLSSLTRTTPPAQLAGLKDKLERHISVCDRDEMLGFVEDAAVRILA